jgi:hypothetical protein
MSILPKNINILLFRVLKIIYMLPIHYLNWFLTQEVRSMSGPVSGLNVTVVDSDGKTWFDTTGALGYAFIDWLPRDSTTITVQISMRANYRICPLKSAGSFFFFIGIEVGEVPCQS